MSAPTVDRVLTHRRSRPRSAGRGHVRGPANVVLVGLSGSGKTTVARLLARRLGWRFVDTDHEIQRQAGKPSRRSFGSTASLASAPSNPRSLAEVCRRSRQVIATGGGALVADANREQMLERQPGRLLWKARRQRWPAG